MNETRRGRYFAEWFPLALILACGIANGKVLFVSASAASGGDGSEARPFNSLAAVESASAPGDEIAVLPSPLSVPPLDGGIALKPHQKLSGRGSSVNSEEAGKQAPRITNRDAARNSGDAIVLADDVEVSNLLIVDSYRGGIYGRNVDQVRIHDNNLTHTNTSCTVGFWVYFPNQRPLIPNGWAAIMVDVDSGSASLFILDNSVHDGACNDGIDIRATGSAVVSARVSHNKISHLAQGPTVRSVLAIGLQTRDKALMTVDSDYNSETYIGSPHANCEGLFTNQSGGSLTWNINHNTFAHGIGGRSCNGAEFFIGTGTAWANLYIAHSTFEDNPGDMIQEDNGGDTGSAINLTLEDVTVRHAWLESPLPPEEKFITVQDMDNLGRCMDQYSWGHQNVNNFRMLNSRFYDCAGDGIGSNVTGGVFKMHSATAGELSMDLGDGVGDSLSIDVENSTIEQTQQYALHFSNHAAMNEVSIRVRNSLFRDAKGPAVVAIDQDGSTQRANMDLGGREAGSPGNNCVMGAKHLAIEVSGYEVFARSNWWGRAESPSPSEISVSNGNLHTTPTLISAPATCARKN